MIKSSFLKSVTSNDNELVFRKKNGNDKGTFLNPDKITKAINAKIIPKPFLS